MNQYEALFILDIQGKDEGLNEVIEVLEKEIKTLGGTVIGTQKMDRRKFEHVAGRLDAGFYLGVNFQLDPSKMDALRQKLSLNDSIYRQFILKSEPKAETANA